MMMRWGAGAAAAACLVLLLSACGGQDGRAAETTLPKKNTPVVSATDTAAPHENPSAIDATKVQLRASSARSAELLSPEKSRLPFR